ncbi:MAG: hypothetical protein CVT47_04035, partial [Thermoplasmata archaeon HGW-Thermoplasmata-2]
MKRATVWLALVALLITVTTVGCGPAPTPQVIKETVPVEVTKEVVVETTREVVVTATPVSPTAVPEQTGPATIMLYTSVPEGVVVPLVEKFNAENSSDITVEYYRAGSNSIISKITTELIVGRVQADVIWVADPAYPMSLKKMGLLMPYETPASIPDQFKDPDGYFCAGRVINMGLAYNTNLVSAEEAPKDWEDLLDPKWKGNVGLGSPLFSGTAIDAYQALRDKFGTEGEQSSKYAVYFKKLADNGAVVVSGQEDVIRKIASGDLKVGMAVDFMVRQQIDAGGPIAFVYPESGAVAIASPLAILASTDEPEAAQEFIDFCLSQAGQEFLVQLRVLSVNLDIAPPEGVPTVPEILANA